MAAEEFVEIVAGWVQYKTSGGTPVIAEEEFVSLNDANAGLEKKDVTYQGNGSERKRTKTTGRSMTFTGDAFSSALSDLIQAKAVTSTVTGVAKTRFVGAATDYSGYFGLRLRLKYRDISTGAFVFRERIYPRCSVDAFEEAENYPNSDKASIKVTFVAELTGVNLLGVGITDLPAGTTCYYYTNYLT